jgi:hypothetical protein
MIAPMKKVYLVMREADRLLGLEELRSFGLVHLETGRPSGENWERASGELEAVSKAINIVPPNKKGGEARLAPEAAVARARQILEMEGRNAAIYEELGRVEKELERCRPWGDYRPWPPWPPRGSFSGSIAVTPRPLPPCPRKSNGWSSLGLRRLSVSLR